MIVLRRCPQCMKLWETDDTKDHNRTCPACRSRIGRAKQKSIQKAVKKKAGRETA